MATTKPPYYWKVPTASEKDYMSENVQRIRRTAAQNKSREPMKAAFIPGVTKNAKYAHVTSRVSELLRQPNLGGTGDVASLHGATRSRSSLSSLSSNGQPKPRVSVPEQRGMPVNRRLSRSSTDLSSMTKQKTGYASTTTSAPPGQQRGITVDGPGNYIPRARRKPPGLQIEDESVYNWRFSDNSTPTNFFSQSNSAQNPKIKTFHRVEYLPCDGICADETVEDHGCNGSGRSSSRTSRGMNTEETRIIQDMQEMQLNSPRSQSVENLEDIHKGTMTFGNWNSDNGIPAIEEQIIPKDKVSFALNSQKKPETAMMKNISARNKNANVRANNVTSNSIGTGTELPHSLGTVPKYLKQRQDEWKIQADQAAAATSAADVPPGHVLLSEQERVETLQELKSKYSMLIDELNRVPIRIDTMRVREHKIQLEQQLQKLERGMAIFSRSRVFVKLPESGLVGEIPFRVAT